MFRCQHCKEVIGPKIGAIRETVHTRAQQYHNEFYREDEWGNKQKHEVDSQGHEIVKELLLCPPCAGQQPEKASALIVLGGHSFREKDAEPMRVKLVASAVHSARERLAHKSKRADRDIAVAVPLIKQFIDANDGVTF